MKKKVSGYLVTVLFSGCLLCICLASAYAQDSPGDVYLYPPATQVVQNQRFSTYIMVNTGIQKIAAYGITVSYNTNIMSYVNIEAGADGYYSVPGGGPFDGSLTLSGFDANGAGPGTALHLLTITWNANAPGTTSVNITVESLVDENIDVIGTPSGIGGSVTVTALTTGDVNSDTFIDIVDALLIAQYYVGQYPDNFVAVNGDVNYDNNVDIVDALLVAQYYVGLVPELPIASPVPTSIPGNTPSPIPTYEANATLAGSIQTGVGSRKDWRESIVVGDYLYVMAVDDMKVFDISDPVMPVFINDFSFSSAYYYKTRSYGDYLYSYYKYSSSGLIIHDITEPHNPVRVRSFPFLDYTRGIAFSGMYAFFANETNLSTVDISDPANPVVLNDFNLGGTSRAIQRAGKYLYVTCGNETAGFQIIDISDPLSPSLTGSVAVDMSNFVLSGNYAYGTYEFTFTIIDISDPVNPFITAGLDRDYRTKTIHAASNYVYVSYNPDDPGSRLDIIDVTNPTQPIVRSTMTLPFWNHTMAAKGNYLYYVCNSNEDKANSVYIINIDQSEAPVLAGIIDGDGFTHSVAGDNSRIYIADGLGGMKIFDVSDPAQPIFQSRVPVEKTLKVAVSGDYAYCAAGSNGMNTVDISDPANPVICSTIPTFDAAVDIETDGSYVYVGDRPWGLTIIDPTMPDNPQIVYNALPADYPTPTPEDVILPTPNPPPDAWDTYCLSISGDRACLSVRLEPRIRIVDISNPAGPVLTGFMHHDLITDLVVSNNLLYLPHIAGSPLRIYDISGSGSPVEIGAGPALDSFYCQQAVVSGNYAYLVAGSKIAIMDVSNPADPLYCGNISHHCTIEDIVVNGDYIYVANGMNGTSVSFYKIE